MPTPDRALSAVMESRNWREGSVLSCADLIRRAGLSNALELIGMRSVGVEGWSVWRRDSDCGG